MPFKKKHKLMILFAILFFILLIVVAMTLFRKTSNQSAQRTQPASEAVSEELQQAEIQPFEVNQKITIKQFEIVTIRYEFLDEVHSATEEIKPEQQFLKVVFSIKNQQKIERLFDFQKIQLTYQGKVIHPHEQATYLENNTDSGNAIVGSFVHGEIPGYGERAGHLIFDVPSDLNIAELFISISK